jgi:hypothetical protein
MDGCGARRSRTATFATGLSGRHVEKAKACVTHWLMARNGTTDADFPVVRRRPNRRHWQLARGMGPRCLARK